MRIIGIIQPVFAMWALFFIGYIIPIPQDITSAWWGIPYIISMTIMVLVSLIIFLMSVMGPE